MPGRPSLRGSGERALPTTLWENLVRRETYSRWDEIEADIRARFSDADADRFGAEMADHWNGSRNRMIMAPGINYDAEPALLAIPSALYLDVLEYALRWFGNQGVVDMGSVNEINRIFSKRGVSYQFSYSGQADWNGDPAAYQEIVKPALEILIDPRLAGCRWSSTARWSIYAKPPTRTMRMRSRRPGRRSRA